MTIDSSLLPNAEDIRFYREKGYFFSKPLFTDAELDEVIAAQDRFYERGGEWPYEKKKPRGWQPGDPPELRQNDYAYFQIPEVAKLIRKPILGAIAAQLAQSDVRLWNEHISYKAARDSSNATVRGWHSDRQYWLACTSLEMLTAWIPLTAVDESMGTVTYFSGSHLWGEIEKLDYYEKDLSSLEEKIRARGKLIEKSHAILKRGQVAFHHCMTIHGSGPNTSDKIRRAVGVHMQPTDNRPVKNAFHYNKILASRNGEIRYDDPHWFPLLGTFTK